MPVLSDMIKEMHQQLKKLDEQQDRFPNLRSEAPGVIMEAREETLKSFLLQYVPNLDVKQETKKRGTQLEKIYNMCTDYKYTNTIAETAKEDLSIIADTVERYMGPVPGRPR